MRPTLISLEESLLAKLNPIINAFKDNQQIANKSQLLPILLNLNKSIMRFIAMREEIQEAVMAIYEIQNNTSQPHHSFGLKNAFEEFKLHFFSQFTPMEEAATKHGIINEKVMLLATELDPSLRESAAANDETLEVVSVAHSQHSLFSRSNSSASVDSTDINTDSVVHSDEENEESESTSEKSASPSLS